jgi:D-alanine-D-alanine ligase
MNISFNELKLQFPTIAFRNDLSWRDITSLKVGAAIPCLAEPENDIDLANLLCFCTNNKINTIVIGGGTNSIGQDDEYDGIVIRLNHSNFSALSHGRFHVTAGAGTTMQSLIAYSTKHGFGGLAELSGIPGTIGGAISMNAGANGQTIGNLVSELCGLYKDGRPWTADTADITWSYRSNSIPNDVIITAVIFQLTQSTQIAENRKIDEFLQQRSKTNAKGLTAGCAFKNIAPTSTAGQLIDQAACKGLKVDGAEISQLHANFIVNHYNATEHDIVELMIKVRRKVIEQTGFYLQPEYKFVNEQSKQRLLNSPSAPIITVLKGGDSNERAVSLNSGHAVANALRNCGYQVTELDITAPIITQKMREADLIFPLLHGGFGENGQLQQLLEQAKIPFIGCSSQASATIFDKILSKQLMDKLKILTPAWGIITPTTPALPSNLKFPVIVKPPREGSTVGIFLIESATAWDKIITEAFKFDQTELLVEQYIAGTEATIAIVNETPLPMIEIIPPGKIYDYDAKYTYNQGKTQYLCPPKNISTEQQATAEQIAMQFYHATGAKGILRVDFIITADNQYYLLEGNNIPGFTASSLVPKAAAKFGWSFEKLCVKLVSNEIR